MVVCGHWSKVRIDCVTQKEKEEKIIHHIIFFLQGDHSLLMLPLWLLAPLTSPFQVSIFDLWAASPFF